MEKRGVVTRGGGDEGRWKGGGGEGRWKRGEVVMRGGGDEGVVMR